MAKSERRPHLQHNNCGVFGDGTAAAGPMLRLVYFPLRARAEPLRMLLRHANIAFTDELIPFAAWPELKPHVPGAQLPQLKFEDSTLLPQTKDIALHAATLAGPPLLPADADAASAALHCWQEIHSTSVPHIRHVWADATPWDARIGACNPLLNWLPEEEAVPLIPAFLKGAAEWLGRLEPRCRGGGAFFGGASPHHGEFATFHIVNNICTLDGGALLAVQSQRVQDWYASMQALPAVAAYLNERPQPGTGQVGRPESLIFRHARPWERVSV